MHSLQNRSAVPEFDARRVGDGNLSRADRRVPRQVSAEDRTELTAVRGTYWELCERMRSSFAAYRSRSPRVELLSTARPRCLRASPMFPSFRLATPSQNWNSW